MAKITLVCPSCSQLLALEDRPDIDRKLLTCPRCKYKAKVSVYRQTIAPSKPVERVVQPPLPPKPDPVIPPQEKDKSTYMVQNLPPVGGSLDGDRTEIVGTVGTQLALDITVNKNIGSLFWGDVEYQLKRGANYIGRYSETSSASVQIGNEQSVDRYMSRDHALITVKDSPNGSIVHHLQVTGAQNPILVNDKVMDRNDIIVLNFGDKLQFGHTTLLFERHRYNEEHTILESF